MQKDQVHAKGQEHVIGKDDAKGQDHAKGQGHAKRQDQTKGQDHAVHGMHKDTRTGPLEGHRSTGPCNITEEIA